MLRKLPGIRGCAIRQARDNGFTGEDIERVASMAEAMARPADSRVT